MTYLTCSFILLLAIENMLTFERIGYQAKQMLDHRAPKVVFDDNILKIRIFGYISTMKFIDSWQLYTVWIYNHYDAAKHLSFILNDTDWFNIDKRFKNRLHWVHIKSLNWTLGKRRNLYVTPYHYHCWKDNIGTKLFWSRHASLNKKASLYLSKKGHKTAQTKNIWLKSWKWRKYVLVH